MKFSMRCYVTHHDGNLWIHGRPAGSEIKGWESGDNVSWVAGSLSHC
ncbi:hypothetical protein MUU72_06920 [Streptomyces sp. RS10V-4]|nr:hypothetical protein [Streptomyces rhizoryzae]MCK7622837.1 hypothetical protein [Streptomyces rhizoryzae]